MVSGQECGRITGLVGAIIAYTSRYQWSGQWGDHWGHKQDMRITKIADSLAAGGRWLRKAAGLPPEVQTARDLVVKTLRDAGIPYRLIGGVAGNDFGVPVRTFDVDVVVSARRWGEAVSALRSVSVDSKYMGLRGESFDAILTLPSGIKVEVFPSGVTAAEIAKMRNRYRRHPAGEVTLSLGGNVLAHWVQSKLASGLSATDRARDLSAVQDAIKVLKLPRGFAARLDPSVRREYLRLWVSPES